MKTIMSFWSEPFLRGFGNGFIQENTWKYSWLLSVLAISRTYEKPILYTDEYGKHLLVDELNLPFADVHTDLEKLPKEFSRFYTLGRAYACAQQEEQFLHVDYDAFLYEKLSEEMLQADLVFEKRFLHIKNSGKFTLCRPDLFDACCNLPNWWLNSQSNEKNDYASLGIVGGKNFEFFKKFYAIICDVLSHNKNKFANDKMRYSSEFYDGKLFLAQYTLDQYTSYNLAKSMNCDVRYVVSPNNITNVKYAHAFTDKAMHADFHGRIVRRLLIDYPESTTIINKIDQVDYKIPTVDIVVMPNLFSNVYENVVRTLIPRNVKPNNVFVSNFQLCDNDKKLLCKLDDVRLVPQGKDFISSLQIAASRCASDFIVILDGHVRVYKLFIEKIIAAYFEKRDAVFCAAAKELRSTDKIAYGSVHINNVYEANFDPRTNVFDTIQVDGLYGGFYVFPRHLLLKILKEIDFKDFNSLSDEVKRHNVQMYCIKNLEVSHNKRAY